MIGIAIRTLAQVLVVAAIEGVSLLASRWREKRLKAEQARESPDKKTEA